MIAIQQRVCNGHSADILERAVQLNVAGAGESQLMNLIGIPFQLDSTQPLAGGGPLVQRVSVASCAQRLQTHMARERLRRSRLPKIRSKTSLGSETIFAVSDDPLSAASTATHFSQINKRHDLTARRHTLKNAEYLHGYR
jgi:hypothetical protein